MLHDLFAELGQYAAAMHIKDVVLATIWYVVHIDEDVPGRGFMTSTPSFAIRSSATQRYG